MVCLLAYGLVTAGTFRLALAELGLSLFIMKGLCPSVEIGPRPGGGKRARNRPPTLARCLQCLPGMEWRWIMNATSREQIQSQSSVAVGSLTARWLLWGLPAQLGLAVDDGIPTEHRSRRDLRQNTFHSVREAIAGLRRIVA